MAQINIVDSDGISHSIAIAGSVEDLAAAVSAHGFDPTAVTVEYPKEYVVRRTTDTDYQIEAPDGSVLVSHTYEDPPSVPGGIAEDIVTYAENQGAAAVHELRKMMLVGFRYVDDR